MYSIPTLIEKISNTPDIAVEYGMETGLIHEENEKYFPTSILLDVVADLVDEGDLGTAKIVLKWLRDIAEIGEGDWFQHSK